MQNYKTESLGSGVYVAVSDSHTFGTDAVLLAAFAAPGKKDKICDMGTGCGIIPMIFCKNAAGSEITAVELQSDAAFLARESARLSKAEDKVTVINGDIREIKTLLPHGAFNLVTMNPPYKAADGGIKSKADSAKIARHETVCVIDDVTKAAAHLLNFGGRLCLCSRPERLCDTMVSMRSAGIEPKRLRFVSKNSGSAPWLFLIEGKKGSKPFMKVEKPLFIYNHDGTLSQEVIDIYGEYKENHI